MEESIQKKKIKQRFSNESVKPGISNIYQRLNEVRLEVKGIAKDGQAPAAIGGYKFTRYDDVADKLGESLANHGIVIIPNMRLVEQVDINDGRKTDSGAPLRLMWRSRTVTTYKVVNADNPQDYFEAEWPGEGDDVGDKSLQKAGTSADKNFLMKLLKLAGGEDTEGSHADPGEAASRSRRDAPTSKPAIPDESARKAKGIKLITEATKSNPELLKTAIKLVNGGKLVGLTELTIDQLMAIHNNVASTKAESKTPDKKSVIMELARKDDMAMEIVIDGLLAFNSTPVAFGEGIAREQTLDEIQAALANLDAANITEILEGVQEASASRTTV